MGLLSQQEAAVKASLWCLVLVRRYTQLLHYGTGDDFNRILIGTHNRKTLNWARQHDGILIPSPSFAQILFSPLWRKCSPQM